ncbi:MAG: twin-arginine translocase TatA/TatE family subunit [Planctomycetales bacterium]|nr:twin-arginine translocase TatA/TatE family subunit [Planctomycetales bacterium]
MFGLSAQELMVVGVVAVILFGKRLPEVARSLGGTYRDFRRGLSELQSSVDVSDAFRSNQYSGSRGRTSNSSALPHYADDASDQYDQPTAPKFELPSAPESSSDGDTNSV